MSDDKHISLVRHFAATDEAPRDARNLAAEMLGRLPASEERGDDLTVILSELVTNALLHGGGEEVQVSLEGSATQIRVEVGDAGTNRFDWPRAPLDGHWGLGLVQAFSERSGIIRRPATLVWCELDL